MGSNALALSGVSESVNLSRRIYGEADSETRRRLHDLAVAQERMGMHSQAAHTFRQLLAEEEPISGYPKPRQHVLSHLVQIYRTWSEIDPTKRAEYEQLKGDLMDKLLENGPHGRPVIGQKPQAN
jgi:hypothetical protein